MALNAAVARKPSWDWLGLTASFLAEAVHCGCPDEPHDPPQGSLLLAAEEGKVQSLLFLLHGSLVSVRHSQSSRSAGGHTERQLILTHEVTHHGQSTVIGAFQDCKGMRMLASAVEQS